jgi:hypothetical protein
MEFAQLIPILPVQLKIHFVLNGLEVPALNVRVEPISMSLESVLSSVINAKPGIPNQEIVLAAMEVMFFQMVSAIKL